MHGDPDAGRVYGSLLHPVTAVRRDKEMIAGREVGRLAGFEPQRRPALQQYHPFVFLLVVPLALRGRLARADDPLDEKIIRAKDIIEALFAEVAGIVKAQ